MSEAGSIKSFLEELVKMEKTMEGCKEVQQLFVARLRQYIQGESAVSKRIGALPFPAAFFTRSGVLINASRKLLQCAGISPADLAEGRINFLNRITTENSGVVDAAVSVFAGETGVANDLVAPLSMFVRDDNIPDYRDGYQTALFFPMPLDGGTIACGAMVLLKQKVVIQDQEE